MSNAERSKYEAGEAYIVYNDANASAGQTQAPPSQQFLLIVSSPDRTVDDPAFAADVAAITTRLGAVQSTVDGVAGQAITELVDPIGVPQAATLISPDRTTVRLVGRVLGEGDQLGDRLAPVPAVITELRATYPAYRIHALNNLLANDEISHADQRRPRLVAPADDPADVPHPADRVRGGRRGGRAAGPRDHRAARGVRDPRSVQPGGRAR